MTAARFRRLALVVVRILVGAGFIYAGQIKIRETADFAETIATFRLLPVALNNLLAISLPVFEVLLGCLLVSGWQRRTAGFCALMTSEIFLLALLSAQLRGIRVECGCFGAVANASPWLAIGRDLLLVGAAGALYTDAWKAEPGQIGYRKNDTAAPPDA